ncbi:MAG: hypothetical protein JXQ80_04825 [Bacteroidales bacterium]|nr:hypothetical protein [Bacteroidales bacterium]
MKKYLLYNLAALALMMGVIVACDTASQDVEPVVSPDGYPKYTFTPAEDYANVKEGDTLVFNIVTDKMIDRALTFSAQIIGGDADDHDIVVNNGVVAPYSTAGSMSVIVPQDWDAEATENMTLEFGIYSLAEKYLVHPTMETEVLNFAISNYVSSTLQVTIGWELPVVVRDTVWEELELPNQTVIEYKDTVDIETDAADEMDFDILISPAATFDISDPWASEIGNYSAATGSNPEVLELDTADLEDGEYVIWTDLYANGFYYYWFVPDGNSTKLPVSALFERQGTALQAVVDQDEAEAPFLTTPGYDDGGGFNGVICKLVVENGVFTIVDWEDDSTVGSAKAAKAKTPRPAHLRR